MSKTKAKPRKARKKSGIAAEIAAIPDAPKAPAARERKAGGGRPVPAGGSAPIGGSLRLEWRSPDELAENPANWRRHPPEQLGALKGALADVGWAGACLFNETTGRLIDGHARRKLALERGDKAVPVLVGRWTEEEEKKILATLDPLSAMAVADPAALAALLAEVDTECAELQAMLDALKGSAEPPEPPDPSEPKEVEHVCPQCGCRFTGGQLIAGQET